MMASEEETRLIRAYNAGYILSTYEPELLESIIRNNGNNDFVKTMAVAKEHHEFDVGIPKNENNRNYKNGFHNARAIGEQNPELLDAMLGNKDLDKDFRNGLAAGKKEIKVRQTMQRIKQEREQQNRDMDRDKGIEY